jgi:hypothetical protein
LGRTSGTVTVKIESHLFKEQNSIERFKSCFSLAFGKD